MLMAPAPRRVPLSLRILSVFNVAVQLGLAFGGFGSIFFWLGAAHADLSFLTFRGPFGRATGTVVSVEDTGASESRVKIRANHDAYSVAGRGFTGVSYSTGREVEPGQRVDVQYAESDPERSRIEGMRRDRFEPWMVWVAIFPVLGFLLAGAALRVGFRQIGMLKSGEIVPGTITEKFEAGGRSPMRATYEFLDRDGRKHSKTVSIYDQQRIANDPSAPILYDLAAPSNADVLDGGASGLSLDETGELGGRARPSCFVGHEFERNTGPGPGLGLGLGCAAYCLLPTP